MPATDADDEFGATPRRNTPPRLAGRPGAGRRARPAVTGHAAGTGRRKEAIARVRILPGSGQWTINGRTLDAYFPNKVHQQLVNEPFVTLAPRTSSTWWPGSPAAASPARPARCASA